MIFPNGEAFLRWFKEKKRGPWRWVRSDRENSVADLIAETHFKEIPYTGAPMKTVKDITWGGMGKPELNTATKLVNTTPTGKLSAEALNKCF